MTFVNGTLSGTPTTVGDFSFNVTLGDSTGAVITKRLRADGDDAAGTPALILGGTLLPGKVGVDYSAQLIGYGRHRAL